MLQITDLEQQQKIPPLLRLGFRPFFLLGTFFSIIAIALWVGIFTGTFSLSPYGGGYWWHIHEMIFGFGSAIIAGFLLTAVQNWTGISGIQGKQLLLLVLIWLFGRIALLLPSLMGETLSMLIDLAFLPCVALFLGKPIIAIKQWRNLFFVPLLGLFTLVNIEMHLSLTEPLTFSMQHSGYAGVMLTTLLISIMAGRVTPMFTANGTQTTKVLPMPLLEKATNYPLAVAAILLMLQPVLGFYPQTFGVILVLAGIFQCLRWLRWKPWITVSVPLLWSLHLSVFFVWGALLLIGLSYLFTAMPANHLWHLLTIGGIGGMILAMVSRVSLGHSGRKLIPAKIMSIAYICIFLSALVRALIPWLSPEHTLNSLSWSVTFWILGFAIFVVLYTPILCSPRADGRPG